MIPSEGDHRGQSPQSFCEGEQCQRVARSEENTFWPGEGFSAITGTLPERCQPKVMVRWLDE